MKFLLKMLICVCGVVCLIGCGKCEKKSSPDQSLVPVDSQEALEESPDSSLAYDLESDWRDDQGLASIKERSYGESVVGNQSQGLDSVDAVPSASPNVSKSRLEADGQNEESLDEQEQADNAGFSETEEESNELGFEGVESYWNGENLLQENTEIRLASTTTQGLLANSHKQLPPKDRWTAAAIARKEAGTIAQGQADVIHSIINRTQASAYGCSSISECVNKPGQYEPTFENPGAWKGIYSPETAARAAGVSVEEIMEVDRNLQNPLLRNNASSHVKCFTDFQGMSQKKFKQTGDVDRGDGHNFFGNFYPNSGNGNC